MDIKNSQKVIFKKSEFLSVPKRKTTKTQPINLTKSEKVKPFFPASKYNSDKSFTKNNLNTNVNFKENLTKYFSYFLLFVFSMFFIYFSAQAVFKIREKDTELQVTYIKNLDKVPEVPESENIFHNFTDSIQVQEFQQQGYIIYRLPVEMSINDVYDYYKETLPQYGWKFLAQIPVSDEQHKFGQYWSKGQNGLRIYSDINDIWYRKLTTKEAESFLAEEVIKEKEIQEIIAQKDLLPLLPDFEWKMLVPSNYVTSYKLSEVEEYQTVTFTKLTNSDKVIFEPIMPYSGRYLEEDFTDYCNQKNFQILNLSAVESKFGITPQFTIKKDDKTYHGYILNHSETNIVYLLYGENKSEELFDYILKNIEIVSQFKLS